MADADPVLAPARPVPLPSNGGTFAPFRYPAFRAIWIANLVSNLGSMIQSVAAAWLMTDLTRSHRLIALVQASSTIPIMLFGMVAGAIADNFDRRRVMLAAQTGMLLVSALLAAIDLRGWVTPWSLLALTFGVGMGTALNSPAWQASVRAQVGPQDLPQGIALNTISFNLARCAGPALGGLLISVWNVSAAFAVNALSYVGLIVVLLRWRPALPPPVRQPMGPALLLGIRFCAKSQPIRRVLAHGFAIGVGVAGYQALIPAVVRQRLHGSEVDYGILLGLFGIGSVSCALFIGRVRARLGAERTVALAMLGFAAAQAVLAHATTLTAAAPGTFIAGAGWVTGLTTINVTMQLRSPEAILGRCLSIYQAVTFGGMALGAWAWGAAADWRGLPFALHAAAVWLVASLILLRLFAPMPEPIADSA